MRGLLLFLALAAVGGTAGAQSAQLLSTGAGDMQVPVTSLRQARWSGTLLQQYDFSCGSAAVATLLTHHYAYRHNGPRNLVPLASVPTPR